MRSPEKFLPPEVEELRLRLLFWIVVGHGTGVSDPGNLLDLDEKFVFFFSIFIC